MTKKDVFPFPVVKECVDKLSVSKLNVTYWQIKFKKRTTSAKLLIPANMDSFSLN